MSSLSLDEQIALIRRGTTEIISEEELRKKLSKGTPLRVKLGVDPTVAHVTLGWAVVLRKLRDFQKLGHTACLIIGDFTSMIGDPSGKSKTRPQLTREQVQANVDAVSTQVFKILDPELTEITFNRDWLGPMNFEDVIRLASRTTVARILERDDFKKRLDEQRPIALHEILYPLCQGYDSVAIKSDIELGGNDQKFNNLVGRNLMEHDGMEPQVVILSPLLVGLDGKEKMSQSLGNYISVIDSPNDIFGKTMSIPDELMENWFELCTDVPMEEVREILTLHPRDAKMRLGWEIVALYHSPSDANAAQEYFVRTFSERQKPVEATELALGPDWFGEGSASMASVLVSAGLAASTGKAKDLIKAGAVSLDEEKVTDLGLRFTSADLDGKLLRVGKVVFRKLVGS